MKISILKSTKCNITWNCIIHLFTVKLCHYVFENVSHQQGELGVKNLIHAAFFSIALKKMKYKYFFIIPKVSVVGFSNSTYKINN